MEGGVNSWGVSRGTLRRALTTLIREGLLKQVQGRGTFVTSTLIEPAIAQKLSTLSEDFASQGVAVETRVLSAELIEAPLFNYVRTDLTPGIEKIDFGLNSLFGTLEDRYQLKIASGRRTFTAEEASSEVAAELGVAVGSPVQYLEQVTYLDDGRPIEYSDVWINSKMLRVTSMLARR
ncbi:GntR family transcriptional regulator [Glaciibacter superstes]|uniref:GntR family transcriptional regulator n=1 Tax=Glaciibacter superstes TaxID=501023 RepID=UPI0003B4700B|nr:GntR family transcriptional regulator [Glaciibacter superstes]